MSLLNFLPIQTSQQQIKQQVNILNLLACKYQTIDKYHIIVPSACVGVLYIINGFLSGHCRMRAKNNGSYPYGYLQMLDQIFGTSDRTLEVCSGTVQRSSTVDTVDINPAKNPTYLDDGQTLASVPSNTYARVMLDPPYNIKAAKKMYKTTLPKTMQLLKAASRVVRSGCLIFLLNGTNYQCHPPGTKRIAMVYISCVPSNETRVCNIYQKL